MTTDTTDDRILVARDGPLSVVRLNDPKTLNAMDMRMAVMLRDTLRSEAATARAIILTGGEKGFCSGANLSGDIAPDGDDLDIGLSLEDAYNPLIETIRTLPVPFVTAVRGASTHRWRCRVTSSSRDVPPIFSKRSLASVWRRTAVQRGC